MGGLELFLFVVHIVSAILIVILVLLQPTSGDGGLVSSYTGGSLVSAQTKANMLTKSTKYVAIIFMINVLLISVLHKQQNSAESSVIEELVKEKSSDVPLAE